MVPAKRKFDWDEAARLRAKGLSYAKIGSLLGVSDMAVYLALDADARAKSVARTRAWQKGRAACVDCAAPITRVTSGAARPPKRCRGCAYKALATSVRENELRCKTCGRWLPDDSFPRNRAGRKMRRGRHEQCRECGTVARRAYRERNKVPCANGCGALVLAPNEQEASARQRGHAATGMCLACAQKTRRQRALVRLPS